MPTAQSVLHFVVHVFNGAGFLPVPAQQLGPIPIQIGHHRMMMAIASIGKERALGLEQPQSHVPQWLAVFLLPCFPRHKGHVRPLAQRAIGLFGIRLPVLLGYLAHLSGQFRAHDGTDRKANPPPWLLDSLWVLEPPDQLVLMTSRVASEIPG